MLSKALESRFYAEVVCEKKALARDTCSRLAPHFHPPTQNSKLRTHNSPLGILVAMQIMAELAGICVLPYPRHDVGGDFHESQTSACIDEGHVQGMVRG